MTTESPRISVKKISFMRSQFGDSVGINRLYFRDQDLGPESTLFFRNAVTKTGQRGLHIQHIAPPPLPSWLSFIILTPEKSVIIDPKTAELLDVGRGPLVTQNSKQIKNSERQTKIYEFIAERVDEAFADISSPSTN
jgi:hypothetical protein